MFEIEKLRFRYTKHSTDVLHDVSLALQNGEIGVLLGRNGSGKTTLFRNIIGNCRPTGGSISLDGHLLTELSVKERARLVAYVPQSIQFGSLSVFDTVLMGRLSHFSFRAGREDYEATRAVLADMELSELSEENVDRLSGGQKQKVAIARALVQEPRLLLFDEPTGNLDIANEERLIREAKRIARERNICILSSLHDLNQAMSFGDRFFFLKDGTIRYMGTRDIFTEEVIGEVFDSRVRMIEHEGEKIIIGGKMQ